MGNKGVAHSTFHFVAEVNVNSCAHGRKANTDPQLTFCCNLAVETIKNHNRINLPQPPSPLVTRKKRKVVGDEKNVQSTKVHKGTWNATKTDYTQVSSQCAKQSGGLIVHVTQQFHFASGAIITTKKSRHQRVCYK